MNDQPNPPIAEPDSVTLHGSVISMADEQERNTALDQAFDYRGDVTIHTVDDRVVQGYVFDRRRDESGSYVRVIPSDGSERVHIPYDQITQLEFSGRDTAAGKSWETWVKKYQEKKARGEEANLHPDPLDD